MNHYSCLTIIWYSYDNMKQSFSVFILHHFSSFFLYLHATKLQILRTHSHSHSRIIVYPCMIVRMACIHLDLVPVAPSSGPRADAQTGQLRDWSHCDRHIVYWNNAALLFLCKTCPMVVTKSQSRLWSRSELFHGWRSLVCFEPGCEGELGQLSGSRFWNLRAWPMVEAPFRCSPCQPLSSGKKELIPAPRWSTSCI